jgi:hypothetical protein
LNLNLKCDILVSKLAFKCNLYRYRAGGSRGRDERPLAETSDMDGEVWALCCDPSGNLAVIGGKVGCHFSTTLFCSRQNTIS